MEALHPTSPHRRLYTVTIILGLLLYTTRFFCARLESLLLSDILMQNSILVTLLSLLQTILIVVCFALFYSFTTILIEKEGTRKATPFMVTACALILYHSLLALGGTLIVDKVDTYDFFTISLPLQGFSLALELGQYLLIVFLSWLCLAKGKAASAPSLKKAFLFISLAVTAINVGSRIFYDISYGAPTSSKEIWIMIFAYLSDLLFYGLLLFFAMWLFARWGYLLCQKNMRS